MKNKIIPVMLMASMLFVGCNQNKDAGQDANNKTEQTEEVKDKKSEKLDDKTVAIVDGEKISKDDYKDELSFYASMLASQQQLKNSIVTMMVQDKLIANDIKKNDIKIDDKEVDDALMQSVQNFGGQEQFDKTLDDYNMSLDKFKETLKKDLMYKKHREWFDTNNEVTDDEIKKYFEDNKDEFVKVDASHILVQDEETAKEIKEKINNGEDFAKLAEEYSTDTASAKNGGSVGAFSKGQMVKEFEDAAFSMKEGEVSDPVKSQFGYHIIKVNKITDSFEDSKEEITKKIKDQKYADYIKKLHDDANVVTENASETETKDDAKESEAEVKAEKEEDTTDKEEKVEDSKDEANNKESEDENK
ncbi:MAG: peptidylprolyl isomerase [Anaerococcus sp.]|uniref:peptidylprolyl isomerase n=1 Tax=Anaerococcus sp. TaxID=1872515 RepID=UPI0026148C1C|nr:peptidylprolyl isomerase [Anaerococcus sp.]MCI5972163.1 peptidylprolyl isomerase [Anaerococcus sp.]MDY2928324.1 peptidylprolyl isomerase [Anaerococcus sp.]